MGPYETDINHMREKNHYDNHSEVIPTNIKNVSVIANIVYVIEIVSYVCQIFPICLGYFSIPITQRLLRLCMFLDIIPNGRIS